MDEICVDSVTRMLILLVMITALIWQIRTVLLYPRDQRVERLTYNMITMLWLIHSIIFYSVATLYRAGIHLLTNEWMARWTAGLSLHIGLSTIVKEIIHARRYRMERRIDGRD